MYYRQSWAHTFDQTAKMLQRLDNTKWLWCLLALHSGSFWGTARSARTPPSHQPSTIEAQAKFFQDFFSVQLSPYKIEFGHVCEDPNTWEQRYEKKDFKNHRDMGKVRWGDKKGGYGEHYWDLNHAGNTDNIGDDGDDGSYRESYNNDPYDEPNDDAPNYGDDDHDPENVSYEESGRAKRAYTKVDRGRKSERKHPKLSDRESEDESTRPKKQNRNDKEQETAETSQEEEYEEDQDDESYEKPKPKHQQYRKKGDNKKPKEKNQIVLVVSHRDDSENQQDQYVSKSQPENSQYVSKNQADNSQYVSKNKPEQSQYVSKNQPEHSQYVSKNQAEDSQYVSKNQPEQTQYVSKNQPEHSQYVSKTQPEHTQYVSKNQPEHSQYLPQNQPEHSQYLAQSQPAQSQYLPQQQQTESPQYVPKQHLEPPRFVPYEGGAGVRQHHQPEVSAATTVPRLFLEPSTGHVVDRATGQAYVLQPIAAHNNYN